MRRTNVKCPVCNQTHTNTHMKLLDWQTAAYPCPIVGQTVHIENFVPGATTMLTTPGTMDDPYQDTSLIFGIADTVPFNQSKVPAEPLLQTVLDDTNEKMWLSPGAQILASVAPAAYNPGGDFTELFTLRLPNEPYQYWGPINGSYGQLGTTTMLFNFSHRIYMNTAKDNYLEILIQDANLYMNYVTTTAGVANTIATTTYAVTLDSKNRYNFKIDIAATKITLQFWAAIEGGVNTKITLTLVVPSLLKTPMLLEFSQNYIPVGYPYIVQKVPGYSGTAKIDFSTYGSVYTYVDLPVLVLHNVNTPLASTPLAATPL